MKARPEPGERSASAERDLREIEILLQYTGPAVPTGAFAYSQGLEAAVEKGWVHDATSSGAWVLGTLEHSFASLDLPVFLRMYHCAASDRAGRFSWWDEFLWAARETRELRAEEENTARSLQKLIMDLEGSLGAEAKLGTSSRKLLESARTVLGTYAALFADLEVDALRSGAAVTHAWLEQRCSAAVRLVPLGQTDGRRILAEAALRVPELVSSASRLRARHIGRSLPAVCIASAAHETLHTRLFLS